MNQRTLTALAAGLTAWSVAAADCQIWDISIGSEGLNHAVRALAVMSSGDVIAGGVFTTAGGLQVNHIARWDGAQWHQMGGGMDQPVYALLALPDGHVIAGGSFTDVDGQPMSRVARWDGREWHAMGSGVEGDVLALGLLPGTGEVVAGGSFTTAGGQTVNRAARWDGSQWQPLGEGTSGAVRAFATFDAGDGPALYAGGSFLSAGGSVVNHVAKWDAGEGQWLALKDGVDREVFAMEVFDDGAGPSLYVGGGLTRAGHVDLPNAVGRWDGERWWPFGGGLWGTVTAMRVGSGPDGPALFAAARIPESSGMKFRLLRWDGRWWMPTGELGFTAHAMVGDEHGLYVGGNFTSIDGAAVDHIAKLVACPPLQPVSLHVPGEYATIQAAIDASLDGQVVRVGPGTYEETINFNGKTIVVESEQGPEHTIIDGRFSEHPLVVRVVNGEGVGTTLRGFSVLAGREIYQESFVSCVMVSQSLLTIDDCRLLGSTGWYSRGLVVQWDADVLVVNSTIADHYTRDPGGGIFIRRNRAARFRDSLISNNHAHTGGGFFLQWPLLPTNMPGTATFERCTIVGNSAMMIDGVPGYNAGIFGGGGYSAGNIAIFECDFLDNSAERGGAVVHFSQSDSPPTAPLIRNTRFIANSAEFGGALHAGLLFPKGMHVESSLFHGNVASSDGGAVFVSWGSELVTVADSTFCGSAPNHIAGVAISDLGGNRFFDTCGSIIGDLNGDGVVNVSDLLILFGAWGDCPRGDECPADLNGDGFVNVSDLLILFANWG